MKLTHSQLKQIIKEELQKVLREYVEIPQEIYDQMHDLVRTAPPYKETESIINGYLRAKQSKFGGGSYKDASGSKLKDFLTLLDKVIQMGANPQKLIDIFLREVHSAQAQLTRQFGSHPYDYHMSGDTYRYSYGGVYGMKEEIQKALKEYVKPLPSERGARDRAAAAAEKAKEKSDFKAHLMPSQYWAHYYERDNSVRIGYVDDDATKNRVSLQVFQQFVQNPQKVPAGMSGFKEIVVNNKQTLEKFLQDVDRKFVNSAEKQFFSSQAIPQPYVREGSSKKRK